MQPIRRDKRYSLELEYCGYASPRYVVRFCGEFISSHRTKGAALMAAVGHNSVRNGAVAIVEQKPQD